jgi:hypothetical protein
MQRVMRKRGVQELVVEAIVGNELDLKVGRTGSHLRGDRSYGEVVSSGATNADGPLGDRTLPPPHHSAISRCQKNVHA